MRVMKARWRAKKLVVFDLDGTLTPTKYPMDGEMAALLARLLERKRVAVIGGGRYELFKEQLVRVLPRRRALLGNLTLFPTNATLCYEHRNGWRRVYVHLLSLRMRRTIKAAFARALRETRWRRPPRTYGKLIDDRGTQVTFTALGQDVVKVLGARGVRLKKAWVRRNRPRLRKLGMAVRKLLPGLNVGVAGYTSIDVTAKGIDKAYGIRQMRKHLRVPVRNMLFVGDALFPGGNDYAAKRTGVECVQVSGPRETKKLIRFLLKKEV